jgi:hypothetical protein
LKIVKLNSMVSWCTYKRECTMYIYVPIAFHLLIVPIIKALFEQQPFMYKGNTIIIVKRTHWSLRV